MEENLQNQENTHVQPQIPGGGRKKWIKVGLLIIGGLILLMGGFYAGIEYSGTKNRQPLTTLPTSTIEPVKPTEETEQPIETPKATPTSAPTQPSIRKIEYKKIEGWPEFKSSTGYSIQQHSSFYDADGSGEEYRDGACFMFWGNDAGGILSAKVVPYDGGSRRELFGISEGYDYWFEEVLVQGRKSLIIEAGPIGDSGSGTGIVIPVGDKALILFWSNRRRDNPWVVNLFQSVQIGNSLNLTNCAQ